ncbi:methylated-DNA--[protein]-cysteine S-methyltransferase [Pediococcus pentosaceus]|uniref:methylated-DNA--[protein]-cysteine S-methyltransferase n=1 Tax=Pediococcus pentosaceus TaxID=1255 RepID=UPI001E63A8C9|nr:MGMT family protein [Pediococcus pentosaceus]MCI2396985.1 MGMT family protein [Pediococcus pentosaceus]
MTYGRGVNYTELAELAETPKAIRAVASAVAHNPILLVIPCHRVIRKDGKIGNYRAGVELKEKLLKMEGFLKD